MLVIRDVSNKIILESIITSPAAAALNNPTQQPGLDRSANEITRAVLRIYSGDQPLPMETWNKVFQYVNITDAPRFR